MQPRVSFAPMKRTIALVSLVLIAATGAALAQPAGGPNARQPPQPAQPAPPPPPPPEARLQIGQPAPVWDSRGWVLLGEQTVNGRVDRDRIAVGRYEGRFSKVTVVVLDSDLEMQEMKIVFGDRSEYNPKVAQFFRENSRTRVIDLPPSEQIINRIDFKYRNLPGGGRARVQVWGFKTGDVAQPAPPQPRPPVVNWDSTGWTKLGEREVNGRVDNDRIEVGRYEGKFSKLTIVVRDSDLEMIDFAVKFGRGPEWRPGVTQYFRENQRTRAIDFPGDDRVIKYIDFKYRNLPGGGRAKVEVWGLRSDGAQAPQPGRVWDDRGWTMLGERTVDGRGRRGGADRDRISVGRKEGTFRRLTVVVLDSSLDMEDMEVKFGRGPSFRPDVRQVFNEGSRTRVIDLPGDDRVIRWIEFRYRNLPGGGRARVQVWAK